MSHVRDIPCSEITDAVRDLFLKACIAPPAEVRDAVRGAAAVESVPHAQAILEQLADNNDVALRELMPACQDTGMAVVFADLGQDVHFTDGDFEEAVHEGVRRAYEDGCLRKSVLDPLTRVNTGTNLPAVIHTRVVPGDEVTLTAAPKGFGSENMSRIAMLRPSDGISGVRDFVITTAQEAGGSPCPPVILGVGIGGTFESCALMAKRALLRPLGTPAKDPQIADLESSIFTALNELGIGPMGLGGDTYCLAVHIDTAPTHIAGLPVAVNYCCHMLRHETVVL